MPEVSNITNDNRRRGLPLSSIVAIALLVMIFFWFLGGDMYRFYASIVFFFYSITHMMWVSVVLLGVFQTLLLIPFRVIRLLEFKKIRDFKDVATDETTKDQSNYLKRQFRVGNWTLTFYLLDFAVQLTTYVTIGRLFLTDFYNKALNPEVLFSFVKYPEYPILERFFKIPYPSVTKTLDFGMEAVIYMWLLILVIELIISIVRAAMRAKDKSEMAEAIKQVKKGALSGRYMVVYGLILYVISYTLIRNFPVGWEVRIFSGDVALQNNTFNMVTAIVTFLTLMWFGVNDISRKGKIAREMGLSSRVIEETQGKLFKDSFFNATLIGGAAYFITNHIPCAFELSIFTLEVISLFSPLTLDRWILKAAPKKAELDVERVEREKREVQSQFSDKIEG